MEQSEAVAQPLALKQFRAGQQFGGAQSKFGVFTAAFSPFSGSLALQPGAHANQGFHADLTGDGDDLADFLNFLDHHDHLFSESNALEGQLDERWVLVTVADGE